MSEAQLDNLLVSKLKEGDKAVFDELYSTYKDGLYRFVLSIVKFEDDAEDIVQQVFMSVWLKREDIDEEKEFSSFLYTIAKNTSLNALRSAHTANRFLKEQLWASIELHRCFTDEKVEHDEMLSQINDAMAKLTAQQRKVFEMSRMQGLSHEEIGKKINISRNTVRNHISESIKQIKREIAANAGESSAIAILLFCFFS